MCVHILFISFRANKHNQNATRFGIKLSKKLRECLSDFFGLTNFLRLEETWIGGKCLNLAGLAQIDKAKSE